MIKKDDGIILRVTSYSDTDAIILIYTKLHGKKSFFVKGGLSNRSKIKPFLQVGHWVEFVFYDKASRELQKITDLHLVKFFIELTTQSMKTCFWWCMLELFNQVVYEEELPDEELYHFLIHNMIQLNDTMNNEQIWFDFHEELLLRIGYGKIVREINQNYESFMNKHNFIQRSYQIYDEFARNIESFKIPKSFEVIKQLI